jgi:copper oxidase (laccase) domain-containing protein
VAAGGDAAARFGGSPALATSIDGTPSWCGVTTRALGALADRSGATSARELEARRRRAFDGSWQVVTQVHGATVVEIDGDRARSGIDGDALVSAVPDAVLAVFGADCPLVALASREGVAAAVHAGWRGLRAGVIRRAAAAMRRRGATDLVAVLGPCIHPECYRFGPELLEGLTARFGPSVAGRTALGEPALDLPTAVGVALRRASVTLVGTIGGCTSCDDRWFSARARAEPGRHALIVVPGGGGGPPAARAVSAEPAIPSQRR